MTGCRQKKGLKRIFIILLMIYIAAVLYITVLSRAPEERRFDLEPFRSYVLLIRDHNYFYLYQTTCNILMTIPLGILLPLISDRFHSLLKMLFTGLVFSGCIESVQYITCRGLFEFDDLFNNTVGAGVGYILLCLFIIQIRKCKNKKAKKQ